MTKEKDTILEAFKRITALEKKVKELQKLSHAPVDLYPFISKEVNSQIKINCKRKD